MANKWSGFRNPKEGPQQGTLFDVREVPSQPVDSSGMRKRGRREEMLAAVPMTHTYPTTTRHALAAEKIRQRRPELVEPEVEHEAAIGAGKGRRAEIARNLADSTTIPPSDLGGLAKISEGQFTPGEGADLYPRFSPGAAAHYNRGNPMGPAIEAPHQMSPGTLVHEIGHHVSAKSPGYEDRMGTESVGPVQDRQLPLEEAFADDYAVRQGFTPGYEAGARSASLGLDGDDVPEFARMYLGSRETPLRRASGSDMLNPTEFGQLAAFETEDAFTPEADASVQAFTRNEGREVLGWGPKRQSYSPESVLKHEYRLNAVEGEPYSGEPNPDFTGANYVSMFNDDVVPERRMDDWQEQSFRHTDPVVKQLWKDRRDA